MLDEGTPTNPAPVFVAHGRRRHHAVRLLSATLGLLLAGWLAALAAGIVGFGPLPAIPLPSVGASSPSPQIQTATPPAETSGSNPAAAERAVRSQTLTRRAPDAGGGNASPSSGAAQSETGAGSSGSSGSSGSTGTGPTTPSSGTGTGSTTPPSGTGTGSTTPPSGTGGGSQSNSGSEPAWTPPETGTQGADPPRGKSSNAPGATISTTVSGQGSKSSG